MSIMLELRGEGVGQWNLTSNRLLQADRLGRTDPDLRPAIESLLGDDKTEMGDLRIVSRQALLKSVKELIPSAKKLPGGFQLRIPPICDGMSEIVGSGGASGLLIGGQYYVVKCKYDFWTMQSIEELRMGIKPTPRYDAAEIATENHGVYRVEPVKKSGSELFKLLREIEKFLERDQSDEIHVVCG